MASLYFLSFAAGAAGMILEMTCSRILAPYLGTTLEVWTALIGVFLGCLSIGNLIGGRLGDRTDARTALARAFVAAGAWTLLTAAAKDVALGFLQLGIMDRRILAVLGTAVFLGFPAVMLGIISPCAARLSISDLGSGGRSIGKIYAVSTIGGIVGTFAAGFILFAFMGHRAVLVWTGAGLIACAFLAGGRAKTLKLSVLVPLGLIGLAAFGASRLEAFVKHPVQIDVDTRYNRVWIVDAFYGKERRPATIFQVNDAFDSGVPKTGGGLLFDYTRFFSHYRMLHPDAKKFMILGSGCGVMSEYILGESPENRVDAVELDPALTALGRKHFNFREDPRLRVFHEDGRTFLSRPEGPYDVIFMDVFHSLTIPFHLATREALKSTAAMLDENGIVMVNLIAIAEGPKSRLFRSLISTYRQAFKEVRVFAIHEPENGTVLQNFVLIASHKPVKIDPKHPDGFSVLSHEWLPEIPDARPLTDDFAPVEHLTSDFFNERRAVSTNPVVMQSNLLLEKFFGRPLNRPAREKK